MKYQQLENLETGWKWTYLIKKHREGERISRYEENSAAEEAIGLLISCEHQPEGIITWIRDHMNPALENRTRERGCSVWPTRLPIRVVITLFWDCGR